MLDSLHPRYRIHWLDWCCRQCQVVPQADLRMTVTPPTWERARRAEADDNVAYSLTIEIFQDWWALVVQYGLDPTRSLERLTQIRRRHGRRLEMRSAPIYINVLPCK
jgi:hypothetical protein